MTGLYISCGVALAVCGAVWGVRKLIAWAERKERRRRTTQERLAATTNYLAGILEELKRIRALMETNEVRADDY